MDRSRVDGAGLLGSEVLELSAGSELDEVGAVLERYRRCLLVERGLTVAVIDGYAQRWARPFLQARLDEGGRLDLKGLAAVDVIDFVVVESGRGRVGRRG